MDYDSKEDAVEHMFEKIADFVLPSQDNNYKSKFLQSNWLLHFVVLLLVLKIVTSLVSINVPKNIFFADITKLYLENSLNQTRASLGLQPLVQNAKLDEAAQMKAENMVRNQYFNHTSPTGISPWFWFTKAGYTYKYAGENLAIGFFDSQEVYNAWLNSPEHKANIVNPNYTEVGTAVLGGFGGGNTIIVVQEFASQARSKVVVAKNNNTQPVVVKTTPVKTEPVAIQPVNNNAQVVTNGTQAATVDTKVLSQTTESGVALKASTGIGLNNAPSRIINSVAYNYGAMLQDVIYGMSSIVIGALLILIFFNFHINLRRQLVFRAVILLVLLVTATLVNREIIVSLIPHKIFI